MPRLDDRPTRSGSARGGDGARCRATARHRHSRLVLPRGLQAFDLVPGMCGGDGRPGAARAFVCHGGGRRNAGRERDGGCASGPADRAGIAAERPLGRLRGPLPIRLPGANGHPHHAAADRRRASCARPSPRSNATLLCRPCWGESARPRAKRSAAAGTSTRPCRSACLKRLVGRRSTWPPAIPTCRVQALDGQTRGDCRGGTDRPFGRLLPAAVGPRLHDSGRESVARRPAAPRDHGSGDLPREVLQAEIAAITRLGIGLEMGRRIGGTRSSPICGPGSTPC